MHRWTLTLIVGLAPLLAVGWVALSRGSDPPESIPPEPNQPIALRGETDSEGVLRPRPGETLTAEIQMQLAALPALRGAKLVPGALSGKVVLVTFFASWCGPCRVELEHLKTVWEVFSGRGVEVVAVNLFEEFEGASDQRRLNAYLDQLQPPFPVVAGNDSISRAFGTIRRIPNLFVYGRDGVQGWHFVNVRGDQQTTMDFAQLSKTISALL